MEGADRVAGQLRGDKECPFNGVTKSGRFWRKVPESDARSVIQGRVEITAAAVKGKKSREVSTALVEWKREFHQGQTGVTVGQLMLL